MNKGITIYLGVFLFLIIFFIAIYNGGKKDYFPLEGKIIKTEKTGDSFLVVLQTDDEERTTLIFDSAMGGGNFTQRLELFLEPGDVIKVLVLEKEGKERTVHVILSVK